MRSLHLMTPRGARRALRRFVAARRGTVAIEMALLTPILMTMLLGILDVGSLMIMQYKLGRAAAAVADLTARGGSITEAQIGDVFAAAERITSPYDLAGDGRAIVTSVVNNGDGPRIAWQRQSPGALAVASHIGSQGAVPRMPAGLEVRVGENIVVAESFLAYEPVVGIVVRGRQDAYVQAVRRPRLGTLDRVLP
jgi:Flp pilus assembly protein TadG